MKKSGALLILIFMVGMVSAVPYVLFVNPTPSNNAEIDITSFEINVTTTSGSSLQEFIFQWRGTNYSFYNDSLILHLNLNNNSDLGENDTLVYDSSLFGNNGTVTSATFTSSGKYEGGFSFDADDELINISNNNIFSSENFSVSMWINLEDMNVKQVSAFGQTTCILLTSGEVYCVGDNTYGQIGDGTTADSASPILVSGGHNFSKLDNAGYPQKPISTDASFMCGIIQNGTALCWGRNNYGQLGDNSSTDRTSPVFVNGTHNFTEISTGRYHSCGLLINRTALCWGRNDKGQLGDGTTTAHNIPGPISGEHLFMEISAGDDSTCGVLTNGTALCWGRNDYGALGDGTTTQRETPTPVSGGHNFTYITNGNQVACGIAINGSAFCWGGNDVGSYLGNGSDASCSTPVPVSGGHNFTYLEQSYGGVCGVLTNGSIVCWGFNNYGIVGDGSRVNRLFPVFISGGYNFSRVSLGYEHACGLLTNKSVSCWGFDQDRQLGKGEGSSTFPLPVLFQYGNISSSSYSNVVTGTFTSCGLLVNGNTTCWGDNSYGQLGDNTTDSRNFPFEIYGGYNFSIIYVGIYHTCGILENGTALCWGRNDYGQLGNGTTGGNSLVPFAIVGDHNFSMLSIGVHYSCGLLVNKTALCWGRDQQDQLGCNNCGDQNTPTPVSGNYNFSTISGKNIHSCGLLENGTALCWGNGANGKIGDGGTTTRSVPTLVSGNYNFSSLDVGSYHTCGILENGTALCWGGINGQPIIGDNSTSFRSVPTLIFGDYNFSTLYVGQSGTCGLLHNGTALCWGDNVYGTLGEGTYSDHLIPHPVDIDEEFNFLSLSSRTVFGALTDGRIVSWGYNADDQQAFPSFDNLIPSEGIYKGIVFGKNITSFRIASTFEGNLRSYVGYGIKDLFLNSGWNYITLTYNGTTAKVYSDGSFVDSFDPPIFSWYNDTSSLIIGEDSRGTIDEIQMWNRTLTASEIAQMYDANLKQINSTSWNFYANKSSLSRETTYTYGVYAIDSLGTGFSGLRYLFVNALPVAITPARQEGSGGGGKGFIIYSPTEEELSKGYSKYLKERDEIIISESETVSIDKVDFSNEKVSFSVGEENYDLNLNGVVKIDTDSNGFYDLEISVSEINDNGYAYMEFKEITEEVESEKEEIVDENIEVDEKNGNNFWIYSLVVVIVLGIVFYSWKGKGIRWIRR